MPDFPPHLAVRRLRARQPSGKDHSSNAKKRPVQGRLIFAHGLKPRSGWLPGAPGGEVQLGAV